MAKLIAFCVYFVYVTCVCFYVSLVMSCICGWCFYRSVMLRNLLGNLSGFLNIFSPVDQFLRPLFKKQRCRSFPCKSLYFNPCATWICLHIHRGSLCELGFPVVGSQGLKVTKNLISLLALSPLYPKTKFRTVLRYF